jgi:hypothetical protein
MNSCIEEPNFLTLTKLKIKTSINKEEQRKNKKQPETELLQGSCSAFGVIHVSKTQA